MKSSRQLKSVSIIAVNQSQHTECLWETFSTTRWETSWTTMLIIPVYCFGFNNCSNTTDTYFAILADHHGCSGIFKITESIQTAQQTNKTKQQCHLQYKKFLLYVEGTFCQQNKLCWNINFMSEVWAWHSCFNLTLIKDEGEKERMWLLYQSTDSNN